MLVDRAKLLTSLLPALKISNELEKKQVSSILMSIKFVIFLNTIKET